MHISSFTLSNARKQAPRKLEWEWGSKRRMLQTFFSREYPTLLASFGFVFHFAGIICGPAFFYKEYMEYINGKNCLCAVLDPPSVRIDTLLSDALSRLA